jgi:hypothetical protein
MNASRAELLLDLYKREKSSRQNFESYWQTLHDYFYIEADNVNKKLAEGAELDVSFLNDATSLEAGDVLASGFMNYLTPPTSKWARLVHKNIMFKENKKVNYYLEDVCDEVFYALNASNFHNQIIAAYKSSGIYGTSILMEEDDIYDGVRFYNLAVKQVVIVEDSRQRVNEYFIEFEYTASQAVDRFGLNNLSRKIQEDSKTENRSSTKKYNFLLYIAKREVREINKKDKFNMPIQAVWIDVEGKMIVDEGGYEEFPAFCHRFDKRPFIAWGYSPAMKALPFVRTLNAVAKTNLRAMMKRTDPPTAVPDNAFIMPYNQNPRAINYYNSKKMSSTDIFAFANYGDPQTGMLAIEYYTNQVKSLMYNDVFLAFNQITKQMNNPEIQERINEKMTLLGPAVGRWIGEALNPIVIRTIGILARAGRLPEPPEEMLQDPRYEIDVVSQLAQIQKRSELQALMTGLSLVGQMAQFDPAVLDNISTDNTVREAWGIIGASHQVLRSDDEIAEIRGARAQVAEQQQQMNIMQQGADVVKKGTEANLNLTKGGENA